jgi:hypothetical protein
MQSKILLLFVFIFFAFTSCKKKDVITKTDILGQTPWKYKAAGIDQDRNGSIDYPLPSTSLQPCMLDNTYIFNKNGSGTIDEGPTKCNPSALQATPFSWTFADNETSINLQSTALFGLGGKFKVLSLTNTEFNLSKDTSITMPGIPIPVPMAIVINLQH